MGVALAAVDDRDVREQALADPEGFLAELGDQGTFIDEVQRAPDLMLAIKGVVDRDQRPGRYLLSGSNQPKVGRAVSDSLLGRAAYRTLRPLTLSELRFDDSHPGWSFLFAPDENDVVRELERRAESSGALDWQDVAQTGGFPRAVAAPAPLRLRLLDDYVEVFSNRDIRDLIALESSSRFEPFLRIAVVDAALALAAAREPEPTVFHLETLVATDLQVWRGGGTARGLYHWRLSSGQEVDFVLEEGRKLVPVEIRASQSIGSGEARHIRTFRDRHANSPRGLLLSCDPRIRVVASGVIASPWWAVV